ncbi:subtilisin-like protease SBT3.9 [Telopea speciosissima]|uniref:subtilisin-like protease SBT3.9 n=1 Tax=Telopea speciosissima TaxID=54955 RepID=UPI001CC4FDF4|nr:subtilisin-like protease SBT3.9 [Telopea speciosissima]
MATASQNCRFHGISAFFFLNLYYWNSLTFAETTTTNVYIVYLGAKKHEDPTATLKSHHDMLATLLGSKEAAKNSIRYSYKHGFSGFAATLSDSQAKAVADFPGVIRVFPNCIHKLHTTRSWEFLGLHSHEYPSDLLSKTNKGEGTIIGIIESGIWPESESFKDDNMGPIPSRWKGICQTGQYFSSTHCNKKIIGARWFVKGYEKALEKPINTTGSAEYLSPRDKVGHGTHCASTAAGRFVPNVSYQGLGTGLARGGAPLARLAIYKACWFSGHCTAADLLKAFDKALHDGVDILSVSMAPRVLPLDDYVVAMSNGIGVGAFHAVEKGITVVCAAGNAGPHSYTVQNSAPWIITVTATTIDRAFLTEITLGNNQTFLGQSQSHIKRKGFDHIVYLTDLVIIKLADDALNFKENIETLVKRKVVLWFIEPSANNFDRYDIVVKAGGFGIIFVQPQNGLLPCHDIPCITVDYEIGTSIVSYIRRTRSAVVKLSEPKSVVGKWVSPRVASFSSRGPSSLSPAVLKPDIAAPGVNILAAVPPQIKNGPAGYEFQSGTSMACPHVAGVAALIKSLHKDWSPAAIKSAIVTTASQTGTNGQVIWAQGDPRKPADPFDIGGGHINPRKVADPGLIYDISKENYYIQFLCSMGYTNEQITNMLNKIHMKGRGVSCSKNKYSELDLNLPSISIPNLKNTITVTRTVTNVGSINSFYRALVDSPHGVRVKVEPRTLSFNSSITMISFKVTFTSTQKLLGDYSFGSLSWTDGQHLVRIPLAVRVIEYKSFVDT